jgi:hypothetical protein
MAAYILTARVISGGLVTAVRQSAFSVKEPGETDDEAARQLDALARQLELEADELRHARFDPQHRRHHWWELP